ncbi:hypothetical protein D3C85_1773230 [compost metagenome]
MSDFAVKTLCNDRQYQLNLLLVSGSPQPFDFEPVVDIIAGVYGRQLLMLCFIQSGKSLWIVFAHQHHQLFQLQAMMFNGT